jgi:uncharacterized protein YcbX
MRVAALYRYPVKGFTPEACETLSVLEDGRIAGDRVLGFRFASSAPGNAWSTKHEFVVLANTPGLARLQIGFDHQALRLRIASGGQVLAEETLDDGGRARIAAALQGHVLGLAENPLSAHADRLPLRVVGDGITPQFQDDRAGLVTLHARESLAALAAVAGAPDLNEHRFRSNIAIEGVAAWEEQAWIGRTLRIGDVSFQAAKPKVRCLATHANPRTGERDVPVMPMLLKAFVTERPTFAIALSTSGRGGTIHIGDTVTVTD